MYKASSSRGTYSRESRRYHGKADVYSNLGLDLDLDLDSRDRKSSWGRSLLQKKSVFVAVTCIIFILFAFFRPKLDLSTKNISALSENMKDNFKVTSKSDGEKEVVQLHSNNDMEAPPWFDEKFRDVTQDLPVKDNDVVIFWSHDGSDCAEIRDAYSTCFNVELNDYDESEEINDVSSYGRKKGFYTTDINPFNNFLTSEQRGRIFAFWRHPFYAYIEKTAQGQVVSDNVITRYFNDDFKGKLTFKELGDAKHKLRERFVIGLLDDNLVESFERIADYYGWKETNGPLCVNKYLSAITPDHFSEMMHDNSEQWEAFHELNKYDLQLYEYARSLFRAHKQTIISLEKQYALLEPEDEDEEEEEEEER